MHRRSLATVCSYKQSTNNLFQICQYMIFCTPQSMKPNDNVCRSKGKCLPFWGVQDSRHKVINLDMWPKKSTLSCWSTPYYTHVSLRNWHFVHKQLLTSWLVFATSNPMGREKEAPNSAEDILERRKEPLIGSNSSGESKEPNTDWNVDVNHSACTVLDRHCNALLSTTTDSFLLSNEDFAFFFVDGRVRNLGFWLLLFSAEASAWGRVGLFRFCITAGILSNN